MAVYGVQTWDTSGKPNNYGIKPVSVVGFINLNLNQTSGSLTYSIPSGYKVGWFDFITEFRETEVKRYITVTNSGLTISASGNESNMSSAVPATIVVFMEKA